jgi:methylmalonyl-CoA/ethylmalonyl-CoA epimerase
MLRRIDHVGIACRSLDEAIARYEAVFGLTVVNRETLTDQGVREAMLVIPGDPHASYVQLLEPLGDDTPVGRFLARRGEGIHHVGYAVDDVTEALELIGATGVRLIDARPRHGSMGASIAFLHPADLGGVLTELVQPRRDQPLPARTPPPLPGDPRVALRLANRGNGNQCHRVGLDEDQVENSEEPNQPGEGGVVCLTLGEKIAGGRDAALQSSWS